MKSILCRYEKAIYKNPLSEIERGNPRVEALPTVDEAFANMQESFRVHCFSENLLHASEYERRVHLYELEFFLIPFGVHAKLLTSILEALRKRYVKKNPLDPVERKELLEKIYGDSKTDDISYFSGKTSETTITVIGSPGMGKTTAVKSVLGCLPQLIEHDEYYGYPMESRAQIVYLIVEAPVDGRCITLCKNIFLAIDDLLKKHHMDAVSYYNKYANTSKTSTDMLYHLSVLVDLLGIGIIAIDEIQRLVSLDSEKDELINFIMHLSNEAQLPILLMGTNDAEKLFNDKFFLARRCMSNRIPMQPFKEIDWEWDQLVTNLWKMQLIDPIEPLTDEIKHILYEYSGGITAVLILLFKFSQRNALIKKKPLDTKMIMSTATTDLKHLTRIIRNKNKFTSKQFSDLMEDAKQRWDEEISKDKEDEERLLKGFIKNNNYENKLIFSVTKNIIDNKMFDSTSSIKRVVTETYNENPLLDRYSIQKKAIKKLISMEESPEDKTIPAKPEKKDDSKKRITIEALEEIKNNQRAPLNDFE